MCPDCNKDLIFKKGNIKAHHFAHFKDDDPCNYYNKPSESQIHKDAKLLMKSILDAKKQIVFVRQCLGNDYYASCNGPDEYEIPEVSDTSTIAIEHRFDYNGLKIADVAYIDNNEIIGIFEICNTHKTEEINRPEPWFEIDAIDFINTANTSNNIIKINCIRKHRCELCKLVNCHRCNKLEHNFIMYTNTNRKWCKDCDIDFWNKIFLDVPFSDKDSIKKYGGRFDSKYKKWYIEKTNKHKNIIIARWTVWNP